MADTFTDAITERWHADRQRCRTDLYYLCRVLGFKDVQPKVHGPIVACLQDFKGGIDTIRGVSLTGAGYQPHVPNFWHLMSPVQPVRRNLILVSRDFLKTSLVTVAHTIQWFINYPHVRILISSGTGDQARGFVRGIKKQLQFNEVLRFLFPEICPQGNVKEFGTQDGFSIPNISFSSTKELSLSSCSAESIVAGGHFDVHKNDDLVDKETVKTPEQIATIKSHFAALDPLLERNQESKEATRAGWLDLVGTIYHYSDLHYSILSKEQELPPAQRQWHVVKLSAAPNYPDGPALWPERWPIEELQKIERDPARGPEHLYNQYLLNPMPSKSGLVDSADQIVWTPRRVLDDLLPRLRQHVTIDLAGMEPNADADNDYTVINRHGFDNDGRLYILELMRSRQITPVEVIDYLFRMWADHPTIFDIKLEKEAHARVLLPFLRREQIKRNVWLPLVEMKRDNRQSKAQRIKGLQPWFRNGTVRFADDLNCRVALQNEILFFPKTPHDDILDTIADAMQNREGGVVMDVMPAAQPDLNERRDAAAQRLGWPGIFGDTDPSGDSERDVCDKTGW